MSWILEGKTIQAMYLGIPVTGQVTESRVKYGGKVQHTIALLQPIIIFGRVADVLLVDNENIMEEV